MVPTGGSGNLKVVMGVECVSEWLFVLLSGPRFVDGVAIRSPEERSTPCSTKCSPDHSVIAHSNDSLSSKTLNIFTFKWSGLVYCVDVLHLYGLGFDSPHMAEQHSSDGICSMKLFHILTIVTMVNQPQDIKLYEQGNVKAQIQVQVSCLVL